MTRLWAICGIVLLASACSGEKKPAPAQEQVKPAATAAMPLEGVAQHAAAPCDNPPYCVEQATASLFEGKRIDGVAQFAVGDGRAGCESYGSQVQAFFAELQSEYRALQGRQGSDGMLRFGEFLRKGAAALRAIEPELPELKEVHRELVEGLERLGTGYLDAAQAAKFDDEQAMSRAAEKVTGGVNAVKTSYQKLMNICR